jgi:hypothetical protein
MKSAKFMSLALVAMLSSVVCAAPMSAPQISVVGIAVSDAPSATRQECLAQPSLDGAVFGCLDAKDGPVSEMGSAAAAMSLNDFYEACVSLPSLDGAVFGCIDPHAVQAVPAKAALDNGELVGAYARCMAQPSLDGAAFGCLGSLQKSASAKSVEDKTVVVSALIFGQFGEGCQAGCSLLAP